MIYSGRYAAQTYGGIIGGGAVPVVIKIFKKGISILRHMSNLAITRNTSNSTMLRNNRNQTVLK